MVKTHHYAQLTIDFCDLAVSTADSMNLFPHGANEKRKVVTGLLHWPVLYSRSDLDLRGRSWERRDGMDPTMTLRMGGRQWTSELHPIHSSED